MDVGCMKDTREAMYVIGEHLGLAAQHLESILHSIGGECGFLPLSDRFVAKVAGEMIMEDVRKRLKR